MINMLPCHSFVRVHMEGAKFGLCAFEKMRDPFEYDHHEEHAAADLVLEDLVSVSTAASWIPKVLNASMVPSSLGISDCNLDAASWQFHPRLTTVSRLYLHQVDATDISNVEVLLSNLAPLVFLCVTAAGCRKMCCRSSCSRAPVLGR
jgi:hypothetical protein